MSDLILEKIKREIENFWVNFLNSVEPVLFQNIILGILAIFIPILIVHFQDYTKKDKLSYDSVKSDVLQIKLLFWLSVIPIVSFSIYSLWEHIYFKFIMFLIFIICIGLLIYIFFTTLKFSPRDLHKIEKRFLEKVTKSSNNYTNEYFQCLWNRTSIPQEYEKEFLKIFLNYIKVLYEQKKDKEGEDGKEVSELIKIYSDNFEKRNILTQIKNKDFLNIYTKSLFNKNHSWILNWEFEVFFKKALDILSNNKALDFIFLKDFRDFFDNEEFINPDKESLAKKILHIFFKNNVFHEKNVLSDKWKFKNANLKRNKILFMFFIDFFMKGNEQTIDIKKSYEEKTISNKIAKKIFEDLDYNLLKVFILSLFSENDDIQNNIDFIYNNKVNLNFSYSICKIGRTINEDEDVESLLKRIDSEEKKNKQKKEEYTLKFINSIYNNYSFYKKEFDIKEYIKLINLKLSELKKPETKNNLKYFLEILSYIKEKQK